MDIPEVLEVLRPGQDWGPCAQTGVLYAEFAAAWRGASPVPTEAEMLTWWAALEANRAAAAAAALKAKAVAAFADAMEESAQRDRGIVLALVDENNLLRARQRAQDAAVAAASSLADLKARWAAAAAAHPMPDRTAAQAKNFVVSKINSGAAD